ncbi:MAG: cupredoxin domain-containing protein [Kiloniellales bacterium]|nr:cupredoxin domain-containing protein [Kiloniellales bacterium]
MNANSFLYAAGCLFTAVGITAAAAATTHAVNQKGKTFSVRELSVAVGDSVTFVNDDGVKHNILIKDLGANSGMQDPGQAFAVTVDKSGKHKVRCGIHPKMKMTIIAN